MQIPIATSAASAVVTGLAAKRCHNVYEEPHPNDPARPFILAEAPGTLAVNTFATAIRGMAQADGHASGKVLIAQGATLSTYNIATDVVGSLTGTLPGSDTWDIAFTEDEAFILVNGGLQVSNGTAVAAVTDASFATLLSDHGQTVFTSVATLGQRGIATYGSRFCFTDVLDLDSIDATNYYTAESSPDGLVAARTVGEQLYLFGTDTIEVWSQTGVDADPFSIQPGMTIQVGCLCRDGIVKADNTLFFVDEASNVRRLGQGAAEIISEPWIVRLLKDTDAADINGFTYQDEGHTFIGFRTPTGCPVYDVMTRKWHTRGSNETDTWRWKFVVEADGQHFVGDADGEFDEMSRDYTSEHMADASTMGTEIVREFTAYLPTKAGRLPIKTVRVDTAKGVGLATGQGVDPIIYLRQSMDGGNTWTNANAKQLGAQGVYDQRTIWRRRGRARAQGAVFWFSKSDPVKCAYMAVVLNEDMVS